MPAWKRCLLAIGLLLISATACHAQGVVPGGWDAQIGWKSLNDGPPAMGFGFGYRTTTYPYGRFQPAPAQAPAMTSNQLSPFARALDRSTRPTRRRH